MEPEATVRVAEVFRSLQGEGPSLGTYIDNEMIDFFPVFDNGTRIGQITSACHSPQLEKNIGFAMLPIERWIEIKLASGMVAAHRRKDLTDVQELIRSAQLPRELADQLDPWVRPKFLEIWQEVADGANDPYA